MNVGFWHTNFFVLDFWLEDFWPACAPDYDYVGRIESVVVEDGLVKKVKREAPRVIHKFDLRQYHRQGPRNE